MENISLKAIGSIHTTFTDKASMPIQPCGGMEHLGTIIMDESYCAGLKDLDGFSYIYLIYYFNQTKEEQLEVIPFNDKLNQKRGVFATRTPVHPNKLGLSLVKLVSVKENIITYQGVDILDNTPLIDIKPFIPSFDYVQGDIQTGWMCAKLEEIQEKKSDHRFKEA